MDQSAPSFGICLFGVEGRSLVFGQLWATADKASLPIIHVFTLYSWLHRSLALQEGALLVLAKAI